MIYLFFTNPDYSKKYMSSTLDNIDKKRIINNPKKEDDINWRNSRALKYYINQNYIYENLSISHKNNYALIGINQGKIGVDLEQIITRNWRKIINKIANDHEKEIINNHPNPLLFFYQIWTIKEAIIKLEQLSFYPNITKIGFKDYLNNYLLTNQNNNYRFIILMINNFIISAVWQNKKNNTVKIINNQQNDYQIIKKSDDVVINYSFSQLNY